MYAATLYRVQKQQLRQQYPNIIMWSTITHSWSNHAGRWTHERRNGKSKGVLWLLLSREQNILATRFMVLSMHGCCICHCDPVVPLFMKRRSKIWWTTKHEHQNPEILMRVAFLRIMIGAHPCSLPSDLND
jgi:hypothetical protein